MKMLQFDLRKVSGFPVDTGCIRNSLTRRNRLSILTDPSVVREEPEKHNSSKRRVIQPAKMVEIGAIGTGVVLYGRMTGKVQK